MQRKYIILFLILTVAFAGLSASAQVRDTDIALGLSPRFPGSNQTVNATLSSYAFNLDKANITWAVNGQEMSRGVGKKSFSFKTESSGSIISLTATVETIDGQSVSKTVTITPASADMLWEADNSYAPPFYKGKTLVASQGSFKVVAMPNLSGSGGKINPNNLSYTWARDGKVQPDSSGWGKSHFIFQNSYLDDGNVVEVKISDITGNIAASQKLTLKTYAPKIVFYGKKSGFGIQWENALGGGFALDPGGETIVAEPYFFSPKSIFSPELAFDWFINGEKIEAPDVKNTLSIKPEAGKQGSATIKVEVNNTDTIFQSLAKQIQVSF